MTGPTKRRVAAAVMLLAVVLHARVACAQAAVTSEDSALGRIDCSTDPLVQELEREAARAFRWRVAWTSVNAGFTLMPLVGLAVLPHSQRGDLILGAVTSAISAATSWFQPLAVEHDADLAEDMGWMRPWQCEDMARRLIAHSEADEAARVRWPWHVNNLVDSLIPAAISWVAFHDPRGAVLGLVGGFALGEAELLMQPTGLVHHHRSRHPNRETTLAASALGFSYRVTW